MNELPHRDEDPVLTLYAHYFLAAELNLGNFEKVSTKAATLKKNRSVSSGSLLFIIPAGLDFWL